MQTATYIDTTIREAVRARSIAYLATDAAPGLTLAEYRRLRRPAGASASRKVAVGRSISSLVSRYPDDPAGDYETTDGGW